MKPSVRFACVFPGQGSQTVGMMSSYKDFPVVRETFAEASDILRQDFWAMVTDGPLDSLNLTINTQPLMLIADIAVYRALQTVTAVKPEIMAGHSLGEYAALVASGVLSFTEALPLVRFRAEVMQQAVPEGTGAMAAILGLDDEKIEVVCNEVSGSWDGEVLEPANFNSPGQIVIAGHKNAVLRGMEVSLSKGAKRAVLLPMSIPSHCSLMRPAAEKMQKRLESVSFDKPAIPLLHNADVKRHADSDAIKQILVRQLFSPVRWTETIRSVAAAGIPLVVECGPGKVLSGLNKRLDANLRTLALSDGAALSAIGTMM
jgi:[acyl-carrier-protein] S-malonyltransferase